jgi:hypothetical protein
MNSVAALTYDGFNPAFVVDAVVVVSIQHSWDPKPSSISKACSVHSAAWQSSLSVGQSSLSVWQSSLLVGQSS